MSRFVVLLRAINVAGKNRIPMAELRDALDHLGYSEISTYVQSGNIVLSSDAPPSTISPNVHRCIFETFGHDVTVILRSANEFATIIADYPYGDSPGNQAGVVFLDDTAELDDSVKKFDPDRFTSAGPNVYVDCPSGFGRTKLSVAWIERQSGCTGTRRNWKTILKLGSMLEQE